MNPVHAAFVTLLASMATLVCVLVFMAVTLRHIREQQRLNVALIKRIAELERRYSAERSAKA